MPTRTIRVQYYALLREQAGRSDETLTTGARDAARAVRRAAASATRSRCRAEMLRVAINAEFGEWSQPLEGRRCRGVHSAGGRRMNAVPVQHRSARHRGPAARDARR